MYNEAPSIAATAAPATCVPASSNSAPSKSQPEKDIETKASPPASAEMCNNSSRISIDGSGTGMELPKDDDALVRQSTMLSVTSSSDPNNP